MNKPNILFLANTSHHTSAVKSHIKAITSDTNIHWHIMNPLTCKTIDKIDLSMFDGIGLHYSIKPYDNYYLSSKLKKNISLFQGVKFLFLQDEYQKVNLVQEFLYTLGFNVLFTLVNQKIIDKAYPDPRLSKLKKITVLTGYVDDDMKFIDSPPISARSIDVSYRGRKCDYWLGSLANEKQLIANEFINHTKDSDLKLDISLEESQRLYGDKWLKFLMNSKAVLGTESGASIWDFDGAIQKKTNQYIRAHKKVDFNEVYENVLKPNDWNIAYNAISPRVFEAAATKTAMIMFPGEYNNVCYPDLHYIVLEKDFSNLDDVLKKLKNNDFLQNLVDRTHTDLIKSGLYSQDVFSKLVNEELLNQIKNRTVHKPQINYLDVSIKIKNKTKHYKWLNKLRCTYIEINFIIINFYKLLFAPNHNFSEKIKILTAGIQRYIAYLLPRFKKN